MRKYLAVKAGKNPTAYKDHVLTNEEKEAATAALRAAEESQPIQLRKTQGDASESGLVKFVQSIHDLQDYREQFPSYTFEQDGKQIEAMIPFSSEIKFNMFVRDMNKKNKSPKSREDNLMVVMKGAPERILRRCSKILVNGEERDFDEAARKEVNYANDALGKLGERVLAFARF